MAEASAAAGGAEAVRVRRYKDTNTLVYRTVPLFWPEELRSSRPTDLNYSARYGEYEGYEGTGTSTTRPGAGIY